MTALWNTAAGAKAASTDDASAYMGKCLSGIDTAVTHYAGSTDPSSGAPVAWGSADVGIIWCDTTDPVSPVHKRWQQLTAAGPTYGWRALRERKRIDLPTHAALTFAPASPAAADVAFTDLDLSTLLDAHQDAGALECLVVGVHLRVRIRTGASETIPLTDDAWIAFRAKGATHDGVRVYAQVQNRYVEMPVYVDLDSGEVLQFQIEVGGGTAAFEYEAWLVALEEAL